MIYIANQFVGNKISTGGDVLFMEILKRTPGINTVIAPGEIHESISNICSSIKLVDSDAGIHNQSASTFWGGLWTVWLYFRRAISTYHWLRKNTDETVQIYLTGDFICNTLPVWFLSLTRKKINVLANFFHRNPAPRDRPGNSFIVSLSSRLLQGISLNIIKNVAAEVFVLSEIGKEDLLKEGFLASRIIVSGAGVDDGIRKYRTTKTVNNQFVYVGRLNVTKGAFDLIKILEIYNSLNKNFKCYFIGQGSEFDRERIKSLAIQCGIQNKIKFMGFVSDNEKFTLMASSCGLLFPSKEEGYGIVVHEALYLGVPVVCYELPVLRSIFGKNDLIHFSEMNNYKCFSDKIRALLVRESNKNSFNVDASEKLQTWSDVYEIQSKYF